MREAIILETVRCVARGRVLFSRDIDKTAPQITEHGFITEFLRADVERCADGFRQRIMKNGSRDIEIDRHVIERGKAPDRVLVRGEITGEHGKIPPCISFLRNHSLHCDEHLADFFPRSSRLIQEDTDRRTVPGTAASPALSHISAFMSGSRGRVYIVRISFPDRLLSGVLP